MIVPSLKRSSDARPRLHLFAAGTLLLLLATCAECHRKVAEEKTP
ncbi:MAG: hypothetical protein ACE5GJ_10160 [Gemmatimonadota bacterium]